MEKNELIKELIEIIRGTKEFAVAQAPDVIHQLIVWEIISNGISIVISLMLGASVYGLYKYILFIRKKYGKDANEQFFPAVFIVVTLVLGISMFLCSVTSLLKIIITPKIFLLEHLAHMVK